VFCAGVRDVNFVGERIDGDAVGLLPDAMVACCCSSNQSPSRCAGAVRDVDFYSSPGSPPQLATGSGDDDAEAGIRAAQRDDRGCKVKRRRWKTERGKGGRLCFFMSEMFRGRKQAQCGTHPVPPFFSGSESRSRKNKARRRKSIASRFINADLSTLLAPAPFPIGSDPLKKWRHPDVRAHCAASCPPNISAQKNTTPALTAFCFPSSSFLLCILGHRVRARIPASRIITGTSRKLWR